MWLSGARGAARNGTGLAAGTTVGFTVSSLFWDTPLILTVTVAVVIAATIEVVAVN